MAFKKNDNVLLTAVVLRQDAQGQPESLNLVNEAGTIEKASVFPDAGKNSYHVKTQYGVHLAPESKIVIAPPVV